MAAQVADAAGGEAMTICRGPPLPIEDAGDHTVGVASRRSSAIASSSVRTVAGRERGRVRSISSSAPPFQRNARWAAALSRSTLIVTSSMRVRSGSFLSRGVVVGAFQTAARSGPSARRRSLIFLCLWTYQRQN